MKWISSVLISVSLLFSSGLALAETVPSESQASEFGVGVNEDGVSILYRYSPDTALQSGFAIGKGFNHASLDYLKTYPEIFADGIIVPYWGVGGSYKHVEASEVFHYQDELGSISVKSGEDAENVGVRVPIGIMVNIPKAPVQLAVELAPTLEVSPDTQSYLDSMIGFRVMF